MIFGWFWLLDLLAYIMIAFTRLSALTILCMSDSQNISTYDSDVGLISTNNILIARVSGCEHL